jgi:Family of unknown function (DUF6152)
VKARRLGPGRDVVIALVLFPVGSLLAPAQAHHSSAAFDEHQSVSVQGTVTKYVWANPHIYIYIEQRMSGGPPVQWEVECSPPSILRRLGWSQATLQPGETVTVSGRPAKDPRRKSLLAVSVKRGATTLFDRGTELKQLSSVPGAASASAMDLEGVWVTVLAPAVVAPLDEPEKKLSMTGVGTAAVKHFDEKNNPGARCVPSPAPAFMVTPDMKRITRAAHVVLIDSEFDAAQRTVHMEVATHEGAPLSIQGHSIGHWEGQTLVIDTARFAYHASGNAYGLPSSPQKHLVERLTPNADATSLTYHFELTDPNFLAVPFKGDVQWVYRPNLKYAATKCSVENARHYLEN